MNRFEFKKAVPVWEKGMENEKNYSLIFTEIIPKEAKTIKIAGSSVYNVYIDNEHFMHGPARTAHGFYRVDEVELDLKKDAELKIYITASNVHSFYSILVPGFLCCEISDKNGNVLKATGGDFSAIKNPFRVQKTSRYSFQRTFNEVYEMEENPKTKSVVLAETEDKTFITRDVYYPDYTLLYPKNVIGKGDFKKTDTLIRKFNNRCLRKVGEVIDGYTLRELDANPADELGFYEYAEPVMENSDPKELSLNNTYALFEFERNSTGLISFEIEALEDLTLYFGFDEILDNNFVNYIRLACINVCMWRFKKGTYKITSAEPYTFKFLSAAATGKAKFKNLHIKSIAFPKIEPKYNFHDKTIQNIYEAAIETFRQNALDIYSDCPSRERAGWLCDSFFTSRVEKVLTGKSVVEKAFLENFMLPDGFKNLPKGMLPMCYPADFISGEFIPNWAMFYVLELDEYIERTNDRDFLKLTKDKIYSLLNYFKQYENEDGLLVDLDSWIFVEWSACNDYVQNLNFPTNMLYAKMKKAMGEMFSDSKLLKESEELQEKIREMSYSDGFFHDRAVWENGTLKVTDELTETCQYYAFFCGTATPEMYTKTWKIMVEDFGPERKKGENKWENIAFSNAFIGNYLRLELLFKYGENEKLIKNIKDYFGFMAERTGTLWEHDNPAHSLNHGFASHVAVWISECAEKGILAKK